MIIDDSDQMAWLHSEARQEARSEALLRLLKAFGGELQGDGTPAHSPRNLYGAAHDYVSHGNTDPAGIIPYYLENRASYDLS